MSSKSMKEIEKERGYEVDGSFTFYPPRDWQCKKCKRKWYLEQIKNELNYHCPYCGQWVGLL